MAANQHPAYPNGSIPQANAHQMPNNRQFVPPPPSFIQMPQQYYYPQAFSGMAPATYMRHPQFFSQIPANGQYGGFPAVNNPAMDHYPRPAVPHMPIAQPIQAQHGLIKQQPVKREKKILSIVDPKSHESIVKSSEEVKDSEPINEETNCIADKEPEVPKKKDDCQEPGPSEKKEKQLQAPPKIEESRPNLEQNGELATKSIIRKSPASKKSVSFKQDELVDNKRGKAPIFSKQNKSGNEVKKAIDSSTQKTVEKLNAKSVKPENENVAKNLEKGVVNGLDVKQPGKAIDKEISEEKTKSGDVSEEKENGNPLTNEAPGKEAENGWINVVKKKKPANAKKTPLKPIPQRRR